MNPFLSRGGIWTLPTANLSITIPLWSEDLLKHILLKHTHTINALTKKYVDNTPVLISHLNVYKKNYMFIV